MRLLRLSALECEVLDRGSKYAKTEEYHAPEDPAEPWT